MYLEMSPFFQADHLSGALLMYHGEHDQNVGTFPIHSWRLFEALEALGKTASLYFYPYEDHGPATQETLLDLWAWWIAWLDKYVKDAGEEEGVTTEEDGFECCSLRGGRGESGGNKPCSLSSRFSHFSLYSGI